MILVNTSISYHMLWSRIGILYVSFWDGVTFPATSLLFLMEALVKALGFTKVLSVIQDKPMLTKAVHK